MERDAFSHIRLWCPRPFGTYTQNKPRPAGTVSATGPAPAPPVCSRLADAAGGDGCMLPEDSVSEGDVDVENTPPEPEVSPAPAPQSQTPAPSVSAPTGASTSAAQVEEGRVLLDTWYVIKPGNTKEKIAFFVAHQISGAGQARPSAMKVKGNWATDCSKAKRRRRCSSYDPPTRSAPPTPAPSAERSLEDSTTLSETGQTGPGLHETGLHETGLHETDLLSVAEMVALVEQRTALALQGIVGLHGSLPHHHLDQSHASNHQLLRGTVSDPTPVVFVPNPSKTPPDSSSPIQTDQELEEQQESCRVAEAIAHFESQNLENRLNLGHGIDSQKDKDDGVKGAGSGSAPPQPSHSHGEVRIAFRVSNIDSRSQLEPAGRSRCMFMTCGGGSGQSNARSKEKITCDLYQLVSPSSRDPSSLLLAATTAAPKQDGDASTDSNSANGSDSKQEHGAAEKKSRERVTGFHVEVVVTGAVDQCVFYGKDSTENVQEETVCFAVQSSASAPGGEQTDDPPPGQLFFLQRGPDEDLKTANACNSGAGKAVECVNNNNNSGSIGNAENARPESPIVTEECADSSLCRLYRHVSHDFLEIRFQIQRLLEPRQYMVLLPDHIMVNILSYLPTRSLAALKCTCHYFKALIETYGVRAVDSRWNQDPLYRDDPCKQCKRQYERGDVSLCRWHPKPYHHDLPYGRSYWMCCRRTDKDTPGCRVGLHDNNWVQHSAEGQAIRARRDERREEAR
ncbi:F-box only protein 46 [Boleophthalmus pectinirostris]|uniref:F-box only protein 46 n=1 Tax=Boleophthalmus pectinirostris TaxID=150288 RepID=UPI00242AC92A|nr:F-box only protein 46 [Boleophthalmus pectinirostris]XP_055022985.1 F-box only protein 46 [Boleophthalmus pectinirostris]